MESKKDNSGLLETQYLESIPGMKEKIMDGMAASLEDCVAEYDFSQAVKNPYSSMIRTLDNGQAVTYNKKEDG